MKKITAASAVLIGLAIASPAYAAAKKVVKADASTCQSLMQQLDDAITSHASSPKIDAAKKNRTEGVSNCSAGKYAVGVKQYRAGLKALGVTPVHHK